MPPFDSDRVFNPLSCAPVGVSVLVLAKRGVTVKEEEGRLHRITVSAVSAILHVLGGSSWESPILAARYPRNGQLRVRPSGQVFGRATIHSFWGS